MLRHWHRAIAPFLAAFLLLIAGTGVLIAVTDLLDRPPASAMQDAHKSVDATKPVKRKRTPMGEWNHFFKKLHSGEIVGAPGIAINIISGVALAFFSISGFWMYVTMWRRRKRVWRG